MMVDVKLAVLTAEIVAAHVSYNAVAPSDMQGLIKSVHEALANATATKEPAAALPEPAVSIRSSVKPDYLVCLEDGKKLKMLKRYLQSAYGMTPDEYRAKWGLPRDYPMVAPSYSKLRSDLARTRGLGRVAGGESLLAVRPEEAIVAQADEVMTDSILAEALEPIIAQTGATSETAISEESKGLRASNDHGHTSLEGINAA